MDMQEFHTGARRGNQDDKPRPDLLYFPFVSAWDNEFSYNDEPSTPKRIIDVLNTFFLEPYTFAFLAAKVTANEYPDFDYDQYKFLPIDALLRVSKVLADGGKKYGDNNWKTGIPFSRMKASTYRHLLQWLGGHEDEDHYAHLMCNLMFMYYYLNENINGLNDLGDS